MLSWLKRRRSGVPTVSGGPPDPNRAVADAVIAEVKALGSVVPPSTLTSIEHFLADCISHGADPWFKVEHSRGGVTLSRSEDDWTISIQFIGRGHVAIKSSGRHRFGDMATYLDVATRCAFREL